MGKERQIAYLWVPDFGTAVTRRADPKLAGRPLVLLDEQGRVLAADALAGRAGVVPGVTERQAAARCPDAVLPPAGRFPLWEAQERFLDRVKGYTDRWQPDGLGRAYWMHGFRRQHPAAGRGRRVTCRSTATCSAGARPGGRGPQPGLAAGAGRHRAASSAPAWRGPGRPGRTRRCCWRRPRNGPSWPASRSTTLPLDADALTQLRHLGIRTLGPIHPAAGDRRADPLRARPGAPRSAGRRGWTTGR